jgi:hypothetical protein
MAGILKVDTIQNANADNIITQTNSTTLTIGASGDTVTLAAGATSSGFGATYNGAVNWDTTPKTTTVTAASGVGYFINTTSGGVTVNLPATPTAGSVVAIADYNGTAETNAITVGRNSSNINGSATNLTITSNYSAVTLVYVDSTVGWRSIDSSNPDDWAVAPAYVLATGGTITTCGDYKIHSFTGPGTFTVTNAGNPFGSSTVDYLVVAGGGGGGGGIGGGGGGGGFRESKATGAPWTASPLASSTSLPVSATGYPITVGAGGTAGPAPSTTNAGAGGNSIFSTITSAGGGLGGYYNVPGANSPPFFVGGSGGGAGGNGSAGQPGVGGAGNTPPVSPSQGNNGGNAVLPSPYSSGGGGAATSVGTNANPTQSGPGGTGATTSISGSSIVYSGGGGGGGTNYGGPGAGGTGGPGGGGNGGPSPSPGSGSAGTTNRGGGGGGGAQSASQSPGYAGGSGIVVIRYKFQ